MRRVFLKSLLLSAILGSLLYFYATLPDVSLLKEKNPKTTALMDLRDQENRQRKLGVSRQQIWMPYARISDDLKKAVLLSEDASFFSHGGVDIDELKEALKRDLETLSFKRGGSTITMQLAKNLYLTLSKNPLRKVKEIVIAMQLEHALSKTRIFEIYLNVVELGHNIYGAEAASRHYFGKPPPTWIHLRRRLSSRYCRARDQTAKRAFCIGETWFWRDWPRWVISQSENSTG
jgi:monofunctional glycosyltransferase